MKQNRYRNSTFELLRIIAIIAIIAHHFAYHGLFRNDILTADMVKNSWDFSIIIPSMFMAG